MTSHDHHNTNKSTSLCFFDNFLYTHFLIFLGVYKNQFEDNQSCSCLNICIVNFCNVLHNSLKLL